MPDTKQESEGPDSSIREELLFNETLKRMLKTPPKPHSDEVKKQRPRSEEGGTERL